MTTKLFLDSGAFSAYQNKTSIDIYEYMEFIKEHSNEITTYANLDSIGSAEETWENQRKMESCGFSPIPVYHLDEPIEYLDMCMKYDYFAVGGLASAKGRSLFPFLKVVFDKVCTKENDFYPTKKVHGFGIATPSIISAFPWYSIDSTSWVQYGRYGIILVPSIEFGKVEWSIPPQAVAISPRSKAIGDAKHFANYSKMDKDFFVSYWEERGFKLGKTITKDVGLDYVLTEENENWIDRKKKDKIEIIVEKGLCCDGDMRDAFNLLFFLELEKNQPKWPWQYIPKGRPVEGASFD
jgi:hypothetical protein